MPKPITFALVGRLVLATLMPCPLAAQESVYNGAFAGGTGSLANAVTFEANSGKGLSIIHIFRNWDDSSGSLGFPAATMSAIRNHGSIPLYSWQPQGAKADSHYALANIINGSFDAYITNFALGAKAWGHPFFLRFAHEMNGDWYPWCEGVNGNTSGQYAAAWRRVRDIFTRNGVTNATWVWCPNTKYSGSVPIAGLYPGDNYVDWISTDVYNRITNNWSHFSVRGGPTLEEIIAIAPGKPVMIAESGCHRDEDKPGVPPGSKAQWYRTAMKDYLKNSMPRIKAWVYFNGNNPDGNDWRITTSTDVLDAYRESIGLSYYSDNKYGSITESPIRPMLNDAKGADTMAPFVSIDQPRVNLVQAGVTTEIRTSASDKSGIQKIEYSVNGVLKHTENLFPYQYFWPVPSGAGAAHTIVCKAYDTQGNTSLSTIQVVSVNPPPAPSSIAASDGTFTDKVRVTWSAVSGVYGYDVFRNTSATTSGAVKLNAATLTTGAFDDATADYGTTYHYWVRSVDDSGPGTFSAADVGHRTLPAPPAAPTGLYATDGIHNDYVLVGWNGVSGATGYEIWRSTVNNSATAVKITVTPVTTTTYNDDDAAYAVNYFYWAKAVNDGGASPFSGVGAGYRGSVPTITDIASRTINQNAGTGAIPFIIDDAQTAAADLTLSAASSNSPLVPVGNIVFGGSGANRSVSVTPAAGLAGTATITVTVTDADGGQAAGTFVLTVNSLPVISPISDRAIAINTGTGTIPFTVSDAETAAGSLVLAGSSSNTALVPHANIVLGGSGANRSVSVTPAAGLAGTAEITLTASDGTGTAAETFFLTVLDTTQALWTAAATGSTLGWSQGAHWAGGFAPQGGNGTSLAFLTGIPLPAGTVTADNNLASPFHLNTLTLSGTGPDSAAGEVRISGGTLRFQASPQAAAPVVHMAADPGSGEAARLNYRVAAPLWLESTATFDGGGRAEFVFEGGIGGPAGVTKAGGATLVLAGAGTYTGNTIVRAGGILRVTHPAGMGANGTLQVNTGAVDPVIHLGIDGGGSNGIIALSNGFGGNSNITTTIHVGNNGGGHTGNVIQLNGPTTGWGNNATLNVTGSDGYGLHIARLKSTGGATGVETFNPTTAPLTIGEYQGANNATTLALNGTHGGNAITGPIVNGASVVSISKNQAGTWLLGGANTYSGATSINGGTLVIAHGGALGGVSSGTTVSSSGGGRLALRGGITVAEPLTFGGRSGGEHLVNESGANILTGPFSLGTGGNAYFIRSAAGRLLIATPVLMTGSTATKVLYVGGEGDVEISSEISAGTGTLGISKTGGGTLVLSGANNFNGPATASGGTLAVAGDLAAASSLTVNDGARFSGSGTIAAPAVIHGVHAPGMSAGTQIFSGSLAYGATARLEWQLAANTTDPSACDAVAAGDVDIADGARVDVVLNPPGGSVDFQSEFWRRQQSWAVLSASALHGSFTLGSVSVDSTGGTWEFLGSFSLERVGSLLNLVWTPDSPWLAWRRGWFGDDADDPELAGDAADPDADGLPNLVEYTLGGNPTAPSVSGIICQPHPGGFAMVYTVAKNATDITVDPQWSADLVTWSTAGVTREVVSDDGTLQICRAVIPTAGQTRLHLRLRVSRP